jgi:endogenous inhibitor of DNA gyrase (YacG/DUF329 family)
MADVRVLDDVVPIADRKFQVTCCDCGSRLEFKVSAVRTTYAYVPTHPTAADLHTSDVARSSWLWVWPLGAARTHSHSSAQVEAPRTYSYTVPCPICDDSVAVHDVLPQWLCKRLRDRAAAAHIRSTDNDDTHAHATGAEVDFTPPPTTRRD